MKVAFHIHTASSQCSNLTKESINSFIQKEGINAVFITDHNKITNLEFPGVLSVPSEEVSTSEGDVIGIFLKEEIAHGKTMLETINEIHAQDGLAVAPHPLDFFRKEAMGKSNLIKGLSHFDLIEAYNSRNLLANANKKALKYALENNKKIIWGSDAHTAKELGNCIFQMKSFKDQKEFLVHLQKANLLVSKNSGITSHLKTFLIKRFRQS